MPRSESETLPKDPDVVGLLRQMLAKICKRPKDVLLNEIDAASSTIIELRVHEKDVPRVVGRDGQTIRALRRLTEVMTWRCHRKYQLQFVSQGERS